jgi:hypothetical protein
MTPGWFADALLRMLFVIGPVVLFVEMGRSLAGYSDTNAAWPVQTLFVSMATGVLVLTLLRRPAACEARVLHATLVAFLTVVALAAAELLGE